MNHLYIQQIRTPPRDVSAQLLKRKNEKNVLQKKKKLFGVASVR